MRSLVGQRGFSLLETLIALGILGIIGVGFLQTVWAGSRSTKTLDEGVQAEALARQQLEQIKNTPYLDCSLGQPCYTQAVTPLPFQYTLVITVTDSGGLPLLLGNTIQKVTISIFRVDRPVFALSTYRKK